MSEALRPRLSIFERKLILALLDLLALNGGLLLALWLRMSESWRTVLEHPVWFGLLSALWLLFAATLDAYDLRTASDAFTSPQRAAQSLLPTWLVYLLIPYITPWLLRSRLTLGLFLLFTFALLMAGRVLYALVFRHPGFRRRVLVIGAGWAGRSLLDAFLESGDACHEIVGFVDDDPSKLGTVVGSRSDYGLAELGRVRGSLGQVDATTERYSHEAAQLRVLGSHAALPELISQHQVSTLVLAITHEVTGELVQTAMDCLELGVEVIPMPVLYERLTGRVPIEHVGSQWYVAMPVDHPGTRALWSLLKRFMDIVLAGVGLLFLGLALPFVAPAIYLDSPGPIFYTQQRVGLGGRLFNLYKFRSMVPDAEHGEAIWAAQNDPRVTRVGRLLRKMHADEFPQFLNILRGEMSVVGPRPERPEFVEELAVEIPFYRVRHAVKPGMAGWGLVRQGYGSSREDAMLKLQYDLYYIKHQSLWLDLVILFKTIADTLSLGGR